MKHIMKLGIPSICFLFTGMFGFTQSNCPDGRGPVEKTATVCSCDQRKTIDCGFGNEIVIIDVILETPSYKHCRDQHGCEVSQTSNCPYSMSHYCQYFQFYNIFKRCNGTRYCSFPHYYYRSSIPCSRSFYSNYYRRTLYYNVLTVQYRCRKASSTPAVTRPTTSGTYWSSLTTPSFSSIATLPNTAPPVTRPAAASTSRASLTAPSFRTTSALPPRRNTSYAADAFQGKSKKSSAGMYAGIGIGCLAVIIAVSVTSVLCWRRKRQSRPKNNDPDVAFNNCGYDAPNLAAGGSNSQVTIGHNLAQASSASRNLPEGEEDYSYATPPNVSAAAGLSSRTDVKPVKEPSHVYQECDESNVRYNSGVGGESAIHSTPSHQERHNNTEGFSRRTAANNHLGRPEIDYQEYDDARDRLYETTDPESPTKEKSETSTKAVEAHSPYETYDDAEKREEKDGSAPYQEYETSEAAGDYTYADRYRPTRIMQQVRENPPVLPSNYGTGNVQDGAAYAYANVEEK